MRSVRCLIDFILIVCYSRSYVGVIPPFPPHGSLLRHSVGIFTSPHAEDEPCLLLPRLATQTLQNEIAQYQLVVRLFPCETGTAAVPRSSLSIERRLPRSGGSEYHNINNKLDSLNDYSERGIGFDIDVDPEDVQPEEKGWMVDVVGVRVIGGKSEVLGTVHKTVSEDIRDSEAFRKKVIYAITKLFSRLRFESVRETIAALAARDMVQEVQGDSASSTLSVALYEGCELVPDSRDESIGAAADRS